MRLFRCSWLFVLAILFGGSITTLAQGRLLLVQGRRAVKEKISFVVEFAPQKNEKRLLASVPGYIQLSVRFADHAATGMVYVDGKALGRFDDSMGFDSTLDDITYGRHTMTVVVANPAVINGFIVALTGGVPHEILEGEAAVISIPPGLEVRVVELERKVHELEAEIATLKRKRVH